MTLYAKSSLILEKNEAAFHREGHINVHLIKVIQPKSWQRQDFYGNLSF